MSELEAARWLRAVKNRKVLKSVLSLSGGERLLESLYWSLYCSLTETVGWCFTKKEKQFQNHQYNVHTVLSAISSASLAPWIFINSSSVLAAQMLASRRIFRTFGISIWNHLSKKQQLFLNLNFKAFNSLWTAVWPVCLPSDWCSVSLLRAAGLS